MSGQTKVDIGRTSKLVLNVYMGVFFLYMFFPLIIMMVAGFNDYPQPSVTVWRGFTLKWFGALMQDTRMWTGLANSLFIAACVIVIAMLQGLAGALLITRLQSRVTGLLYTIMVSPILTPGIIVGISTTIFWRDLGVGGGFFTAILAQSTFISSFAMLMFMARLQRQDISLEEAALDLGATHAQAFRRITIPFLKPTIATASVIAFLQSFENYNTTIFSIGGEHTLVTEIGSRMLFSIGGEHTLVTEIGSRMRFGLSPTINVIGIIFVVLTVIFATTYVLFRERERRKAAAIEV